MFFRKNTLSLQKVSCTRQFENKFSLRSLALSLQKIKHMKAVKPKKNLGVGPNKIGNVYGIMKAYCTRVGAGPFPTELFDETGAKIRDLGHEYGAVTGRERRCGWCDLVQLKYSVMVNGVTQLIMMKSDVLDSFETIKACVAYKLKDGTVTTDFPYEIDDVEPVYKEFKGWNTDMTQFTSEDEFPQEFKDYIAFVEDFLETRIGIISIGPDRAQTIVRK